MSDVEFPWGKMHQGGKVWGKICWKGIRQGGGKMRGLLLLSHTKDKRKTRILNIRLLITLMCREGSRQNFFSCCYSSGISSRGRLHILSNHRQIKLYIPLGEKKRIDL